MRLLVTRPEPDASELARRLEGLGHEAIVAPLLVTELEPVEDIDFEGVQALIATSRNAIRAIARRGDIEQLFGITLYAVGPGTAGSARALGFTQVIEGPKAGRELVALIALQAEVNGGPLMHLAGAVKAMDLAGELRRLGFHVLEPVVYAVRPARELTAQARQIIAARALDGVLLFSPATAKTWAALVAKAGLSEAVRDVRHYCLSPAVARALGPLALADVACALQPNLEQMLALVARTAPQSR